MTKILYISDAILEKNIGSYQLCCSHLQSLKDIVGKNNVDVIALTGRNDLSTIETGYMCYQGNKNKLGKLFNMLTLNNPAINNRIINSIIIRMKTTNYDVVFIDSSGYGILVKQIKKNYPNIKIITFYHDVKRNLCKLWLKEYGIKYLPEYIVNIYNEYLNVKYCDFNITLNTRETNLFRKYYKKNSDLELPIYFKDPLGSLYDEIKSVKIEPKTNLRLLFVGAYYYPNVKGIKWFIENVMPELPEDISLNVVGRGIDRIVEELDNQFLTKNINIIGEVDSLMHCYLSSDIVIAPIFEGAGMKVKTAEALSYGKTIIGTSESFEGYSQLTDACNTKEEFIKAIDSIYKNKNNLLRFNQEMYSIFKENYSLESANSKLKDLIEK